MASLDLVFIDDATQRKPSRAGMKPVAGLGALHVPGRHARSLETTLGGLCVRYGFPPKEEFKWSPERKQWMHKNLVGPARTRFFIDCLDIAARHECTATVVITDTKSRTATGAKTHQEDVLRLLLERINWLLAAKGTEGVLVADQPTGGKKDEAKFLADCLVALEEGTQFVLPDRIAINVLTTPSHLVRCIQLADLIAGCTVAHVAGSSTWTKGVFPQIINLLRIESGRRGGVGLKLHPDGRYLNLYHWLLGDSFYLLGGLSTSLPNPTLPYASSSDKP